MFKSDKVIIFIILFVVVAITVGCVCLLFDSDEKVFSKDGMSITLTENFVENEYYGFTAYYDTEDAQVYVMKESFSLLKENDQPTNISTKAYAEIMLKTQELDAEVFEKDGLTYFYYEKDVLGYSDVYVRNSYYAVAYKTDDAFWLFQFACEKSLYDEYEEKFVEWAKSVEFD